MSVLRFLRDKALFLLLGCAAIVFAGVFLSAFSLPPFAVFFVVLVLTVAAAVMLVYEFARKRAYYTTVIRTFEQLDQKYLITELIEPAWFSDSIIFYEILQGASKSMNDKIAEYRKMTEEYREFIEMWVHEIKTPIASAALTAENNPGQTMDRVRGDLEKIEELVGKVLFYARSNDVEKDYVIREVPLRDLVSGVVRRNAKALIQGKFKVDMENLDMPVFTDEKWMDFILGQIIGNAVKYAGEGPRSLRFGAAVRGSGIDLYIRDNGIGIPEKDLPRVFDKGFTGENGRRYAKSTGMGLYLCKKLCDKLGVGLRADTGNGTTFTVTFPKSNMYFR